MYKHQSKQPAKKIVLLSDGTGNSSAKLMKTNVWRMYQALDLSKGDQIAMYDNGVGTSSVKLLALLGGGLGFGLKRNVLQLYKFACQNYVPGDGKKHLSDELYLFGFSRGAFTVRVLAGLIAKQGLIMDARGHDLEHLARLAYREYRQTFETGRLVAFFQKALYKARVLWERVVHPTWPTLVQANREFPRIAFMGLWDTVDAYGLPIDEMTTGWDQYVWPLTLRNREPLAEVDKISHALALDDERLSFHPVLYTEADIPLATHTDDEHVTQVWFAGMHSDVGGGYPDDALAYVPLCWMAEQAMRVDKSHGLRLFPNVLAEWQAHANPGGVMHDSRRGPAAYYRYKPRSIETLCNDGFDKVSIPRPKIHHSAFDRIVSGRDDYAPIVLPERYAVVKDDGAIVDGTANPYEKPDQAAERVAGQERVWDQVWVRRGLYFGALAMSFLLVVAPFLISTFASDWLNIDARAFSRIIDLIGKFLPDFMKPWIQYYRVQPAHLVVLLGGLMALLWYSTRLERSLRQNMLIEWDRVLKVGPQTEPTTRAPEGWIFRIRTSFGEDSKFERLTQKVVPPAFGIGALVTIVLLILIVLNRALFSVATTFGSTCEHSASKQSASNVSPDDLSPWTRKFSNKELCTATGITLIAGKHYSVHTALPQGGWKDCDHVVTSVAGVGSFEQRNIAFILGLPLRRLITVGWFVPTARINKRWISEYHPLDKETVTITPRRDGELFLFVNDAVGLWPAWRYFYNNNDGLEATVTVTEVK